MIDCSKEIEKYFSENVRLPENERKEMRNRRKSNQNRLKSGLKNKDKPTPKYHVKQGSYAMFTMVLPPDKNPIPDYDIDDGAVFDREELKGPQGGDMEPREAREMVRKALDDVSFKTPPKTLKNCVRVFYETGYHVDIPVYREFEDDDGNIILELASSEWRPSDPSKITAWFNNAVIEKSPDNTNGRQMRREVCLFKKFARSRKSWNMPSGLILSVLTDEAYIANEERDDETLYDLMQKIYNRLRLSGRQVYNPCDRNEELTKGTDDPKMCALEDYLAWALDRLNDVKNEQCDKNEALRRWNEMFNTDFFIQFIEEDEEARLNSLNILVTSAAATSPKQWAY
jgi:hypothetical protein